MDKQRDVVELPISDDLDINGWDIPKALTLLYKSSPTVFEWCASPIVYKTSDFAAALSLELPKFFSVKNGLWHYFSMAERNYKQFLTGDMIKAKKYFYVLRPMLACRWILQQGTPPPMLFEDLVNSQLDKSLVPMVQKLLKQKMEAPEIKKIPKIAALNDYLEQSMADIRNSIVALPQEKQNDWSGLNRLFLQAIGY